MELIFTIFIIIVLLGFLFRLLAPYLLKAFVKRMSKRFDEQQQYYQRQNTSSRRQRPEGEVTIEQNKSNEKVIDKNIGEYVEFEEEDK